MTHSASGYELERDGKVVCGPCSLERCLEVLTQRDVVVALRRGQVAGFKLLWRTSIMQHGSLKRELVLQVTVNPKMKGPAALERSGPDQQRTV